MLLLYSVELCILHVCQIEMILLMDDRIKKALPEEYQKRTEASLVTALLSASLATLTCYPLDTIRRQMQMKGAPYKTVLDAFPGDLNLAVCYHH